jgi:hypothetical protein
MEVVDFGNNPVGQVLEDLVDCTFELGTIHQSNSPMRASERQGSYDHPCGMGGP